MLSDWMSFIGLTAMGIQPLHAQMTSRIVGGVLSFTCNKFWSFDAKGSRRLSIEARRFLALYAFSYVTSVSMFYMLTEIMAISPIIAKAVSDTSIFFINFAAMRLYVFHQRRGFTSWARQIFERKPHH